MRTKQGVVTSAGKMKDTVTVTVHRSVVHPLYQKRYRVSKKFLADTAGKDIGMGDLVVITECKPLSKRKHFQVTEIVTAAPRVSEMVEEAGLEGVIHKAKKEKDETPESSDTSDSSK